ncbi:MAG: helix-turn-helix domain-containing protein [Actinomycetales bacterium]|nr:helix-turn-helix domain-containing protein [Actinomycetales bacterium]
MTFLTVNEIAAWVRLSEHQVRNNIHDGRLRAIQPGNVYRIDINDLREWSGVPTVTVEEVLSAYETARAKSAITK